MPGNENVLSSIAANGQTTTYPRPPLLTEVIRGGRPRGGKRKPGIASAGPTGRPCRSGAGMVGRTAVE